MRQLQLIAHGELQMSSNSKPSPNRLLVRRMFSFRWKRPAHPSDFFVRPCMYGIRQPSHPGRGGGVGRVARLDRRLMLLCGQRVLILPTYEQGTWADEVVVPCATSCR